MVRTAEDMSREYPVQRLFFDDPLNAFGARSPEDKHYPVIAKLKFPCTKNIAEHEVCI